MRVKVTEVSESLSLKTHIINEAQRAGFYPQGSTEASSRPGTRWDPCLSTAVHAAVRRVAEEGTAGPRLWGKRMRPALENDQGTHLKNRKLFLKPRICLKILKRQK